MKARHARCNKKESYGLTEYDAHPHQCTLAAGHVERGQEHDFSKCPEGRPMADKRNVAS